MNQAGSEGTWPKSRRTAEYVKRPRKGSSTKNQDLGMETGIAKKSGNADGVKVSTDIELFKEKHSPYSKMEHGWQMNWSR